MKYNCPTKKCLFELPVEVTEQFQKKYPRLMSTYIRRCMLLAIENQTAFERIFFGVKDKYSVLGMFRPEYVFENDDLGF